MRTLFVLGLGASLLAAAAPRTVEETLPAYSQAFDTAFRRMGTVELSDTQGRIRGLGEAGKPFQAELEDLRRRQGEVNDLVVKAVGLKKQALAEKKATIVDEAIKVLKEADTKALSLGGDLKRLNEKLTAAGAREVKAGPARDPNARD